MTEMRRPKGFFRMFFKAIVYDVILSYLFFFEIYEVEFVLTLVNTFQLRVKQVLNYDSRLSVFKGRINLILLDLLDELLDYTLKLLNECVPRFDVLL